MRPSLKKYCTYRELWACGRRQSDHSHGAPPHPTEFQKYYLAVCPSTGPIRGCLFCDRAVRPAVRFGRSAVVCSRNPNWLNPKSSRYKLLIYSRVFYSLSRRSAMFNGLQYEYQARCSRRHGWTLKMNESHCNILKITKSHTKFGKFLAIQVN